MAFCSGKDKKCICVSQDHHTETEDIHRWTLPCLCDDQEEVSVKLDYRQSK